MENCPFFQPRARPPLPPFVFNPPSPRSVSDISSPGSSVTMTTEPDNYFDPHVSPQITFEQGRSVSYTPPYTPTYTPRAASTLRNSITPSEFIENGTRHAAQLRSKSSRASLGRRTSGLSLQQHAMKNQACKHSSRELSSRQRSAGASPYPDAPALAVSPASTPTSNNELMFTNLPRAQFVPLTQENLLVHEQNISSRLYSQHAPSHDKRKMVYEAFRSAVQKDPVPRNTRSESLEAWDCVGCMAHPHEHCPAHCGESAIDCTWRRR